jgi:hypothetical protein
MNGMIGGASSALGLGDQLRSQVDDEEMKRRKKLMRLAQPGTPAVYGTGMGPAAADLIGYGRG